MSEEQSAADFIRSARRDLGKLWGLERELTRAELSRALDLSPKHGGSFIAKLESGATMTGPVRVAIKLMMSGGVPDTMDHVIKPGYPRRHHIHEV